MAAISFSDAEGFWIAAGGNPLVAPIAAAIAAAESSLNPSATNTIDNGGSQTSWGLWQVSDGTHNAYVTNWDDPLTNAKAAVAKYNAAGGFTPWGTFTSGAYLSHLSDAVAHGATSTVGGASASSPSGSMTATPAPSFAPKAIANATPIIFFAAIVLLIGLYAASRSQTPGAS